MRNVPLHWPPNNGLDAADRVVYIGLMDLGTHPYETLEAEVLHLPREDRSKLASRLIESLDEDEDTELSAEWREELQRRVDEIDAGKAKMIPAREVWESLNKRFGTDL